MFGKNKEQQADLEFFTIFDVKIGRYWDKTPMTAINHHDMIRQIQDLFTDPQQNRNQLLTNAEDFQLFKIGAYHKSSASIIPQNPEHIANLHELKSSIQQRALSPT